MGLPTVMSDLIKVIDKVDSIIDWLTAHDEREEEMLDQIRANSALIEGKFTPYEPPMKEANNKPPIEQEIEAGLEQHLSGRWCVPDNGEPCTRIFLPEAEYEAFKLAKRDKSGRTIHVYPLYFHDIPVYSYSGSETIYCTD